MIVELLTPHLLQHMATATVTKVLVAPGERIEPGSTLLDLRIDLSAALEHDCPPISDYRLVSSETLWVREVLHPPGAIVAVGERLALLSTSPDEPLGPPTRAARINALGHIATPDWWTDDDGAS